MICPNCGAPLPDTVTMCYSCRKIFDSNAEPKTNPVINTISNETVKEVNNNNEGLSSELKNTVLKYLSEIIDVESRIYIQEEFLSKLKQQYASLNIDEPEIGMGVVKKDEVKVSAGGCIFGGWMLAAGLFGLKSPTFHVADALLILLGIVILFFAITRPKAKANAEAKYEEETKKQKDIYNQRIEERDMRIAQRDRKKDILEYEIHMVEDGLRESKDILEKMYDINLIYKSYRGVANVCAIYDYIASNAASTMKEVYNILIPHIDRGEIITNLQQINRKLDYVMINQRHTYDVVVESNNKIEHLVQSSDSMCNEIQGLRNDTQTVSGNIEEIKKNSDLSIYYSEQTAKQLEYSNMMNYYHGEFSDAGILNQPPSI